MLRAAEDTRTPARIAPPTWVVIALACAGQFLVVLDVSVVNVALPSMRTDLGLSAPGLQWVVNAYSMAFAGFMLLGGRAGDLYGRKRMFLVGLALFTLASAAAWPRPGRHPTAARAGRAGSGGRGARALHADDPDVGRPRGRRPCAGHRDLDRRRRRWRRRGRTRRRTAGRRAVLAMGAPHQRARRRGGAGRRGALAGGEPGRGRATARPAGRAPRDVGPRDPGVRDRADGGRGVDGGGDAGAALRGSGSPRGLPGRRGADRGTADAAETAAAAVGVLGERGHVRLRLRDVLHVVLHDAVRAERARLLAARRGPRPGAEFARGGRRLEVGAAPHAGRRGAQRGGSRHAPGRGRLRLAVDHDGGRPVLHGDHAAGHPDDGGQPAWPRHRWPLWRPPARRRRTRGWCRAWSTPLG